MEPVTAGLVGTVALLVLFALDMPVAFAMALVGFLGFSYIVGWESGAALLANDMFDQLSFYPLSVIVLFVLMGSFAFASGMSRRLYDSSYKIAGRLPGGLAFATVLACTGFAAICGSTAATAATVGRVALSEMKRYGYSDSLATGAVAATGSIGILIPPSTIFIVYGILTEQSIGELFAAGILPGIMLCGLFLLTVLIIALRHPEMAPAGTSSSLREKVTALWKMTDIFILFFVSIGGLFLGWFSPNQAAGVGAGGALLIGILGRELTWEKFILCTRQGLRTACMVMFLIAGATVFGKFMAVSTIPTAISTWIGGLPYPPVVIMAILCVIFFIGGCFIDAMALVILTVPMLYPVVLKINYDPVFFGVVVVLVSQIGVITPPVGANVFVVKGIAEDVPIEQIFKGTFPFLLAIIVALCIVVAFPEITLYLPKLLVK
ncbi:MAG: TRAP transporter large permease [Pseudomonadota bacterium]